MSEKRSMGYERYLKGLEMQRAGMPAAEIARALGLKDAQAWYSTRAYNGAKRLALRAAELKEETPVPAAILADIDCERSAPRAAVTRGGGATRMQKAECKMQNDGEARRETAGCDGDAVMGSGLSFTKIFTAQGEVVRYRVADGQVCIGVSGKKRGSLTLSPAECRVMMQELGEVLALIGGTV